MVQENGVFACSSDSLQPESFVSCGVYTIRDVGCNSCSAVPRWRHADVQVVYRHPDLLRRRRLLRSANGIKFLENPAAIVSAYHAFLLQAAARALDVRHRFCWEGVH